MNLYAKRKSAGLTQETVAKSLNVSVSAVSQWESGTTKPKIEYLMPLAKLYGCKVDDLFATDDELRKEVEK